MHGSQHSVYAFVPPASPGATAAEIRSVMQRTCIRVLSDKQLRHHLEALAQNGTLCREVAEDRPGRPFRYWRTCHPTDL